MGWWVRTHAVAVPEEEEEDGPEEPAEGGTTQQRTWGKRHQVQRPGHVAKRVSLQRQKERNNHDLHELNNCLLHETFFSV